MTFPHRTLVLTLAIAFAPAAFSQSAQHARILALETAWNQALLQKDTRAIDALLGDELITIDSDGTLMTKRQYLASLRTPALRFDHIVSNSMQVQFFGQSAIVIGIYSEKGVKNGKPFLHRERFVDTWIDHGGTWLCIASQSTLILH